MLFVLLHSAEEAGRNLQGTGGRFNAFAFHGRHVEVAEFELLNTGNSLAVRVDNVVTGSQLIHVQLEVYQTGASINHNSGLALIEQRSCVGGAEEGIAASIFREDFRKVRPNRLHAFGIRLIIAVSDGLECTDRVLVDLPGIVVERVVNIILPNAVHIGVIVIIAFLGTVDVDHASSSLVGINLSQPAHRAGPEAVEVAGHGDRLHAMLLELFAGLHKLIPGCGDFSACLLKDVLVIEPQDLYGVQ